MTQKEQTQIFQKGLNFLGRQGGTVFQVYDDLREHLGRQKQFPHQRPADLWASIGEMLASLEEAIP